MAAGKAYAHTRILTSTQMPTTRAYRLANKEKIAAYFKKWASENVEKRRASRRKVVRKKAPPRVLRTPEEKRATRRKWLESGDVRKRRSARLRENRRMRRAIPGVRRAEKARDAAAKLRATPPWADKKAIDGVYRGAANLSRRFGERFEVDHVVPLRSKLVCGLHCEANLQVLASLENARKSNVVWPDMP